jgi:hypothetical protein
VHFGLWFLTLQSALVPHCSNGQGFWHSLLMHACDRGHSESDLHPAVEKDWANYKILIGLWNIVFKHCSISLFKILLTFFAKTIRISYISRKTNTNRTVIFGFTFSVSAARMGVTWILTFLLYTCKVIGTFRVNSAFRFWCWKNHAFIYSCHLVKIQVWIKVYHIH